MSDDPMKALVRKYDRAVVASGGSSLFRAKPVQMAPGDIGVTYPKTRKLGWLKLSAPRTELGADPLAVEPDERRAASNSAVKAVNPRPPSRHVV